MYSDQESKLQHDHLTWLSRESVGSQSENTPAHIPGLSMLVILELYHQTTQTVLFCCTEFGQCPLNWNFFVSQTPLHQVGAFAAIFCGILGPGILLMLTRERPISEH